ncbi:hypothetical protein NMY22_g15504 [Coprinellus aureogranulatus]|nr:hypothetical protein NMY22_g15504 [Coprinellus aureogranulatus]
MDDPRQGEFTLDLLYSLQQLPAPAQDVGILASRYSELSVVFSSLGITERARGFGAHANHLTRLASVVISFPRIRPDKGPLWTALNFFSFFSLFLDTFSAFFCLLFTGQLSKRLDACHSLTDAKGILESKIKHFATLRKNGKQPEADQFFADSQIAPEMSAFVASLRQIRQDKVLYHPVTGERVVKATILLSIISFVAALTLFIRETQERLVWLTTLPISTGVAFLLIVNEYESRFRGFTHPPVVTLPAHLPHP